MGAPATHQAGAQAALDVTVETVVEPATEGVFGLAWVKAPQLGLADVALVLDLPNNRVAMVAACGCFVHVPLSSMLYKLSSMVLEEKHGALLCDTGAAATGVH